jgi:hypothetical protein
MIRTQLFVLVFILAGALMAAGQSLSPTVISASGGSGSANGASLSWTTGELMVQTFSSDSLLLTQGFQQGNYSISTAVNEFRELQMDVEIFPNPVKHTLSIDFQGMVERTARLRLMNLTGKTLMTRNIANPEGVYRLNMSGYSPGTYMLEIRVDNSRKAFKIVKH